MRWPEPRPSPAAASNSRRRCWLRIFSPTRPAEPGRPEAKVVPKGLRAFDAGDADFYLQLLPPPYHRDGLPETVRFWKIRIEEREPDTAFPVGLLHGPSGCGKSSLVQAGL